MNLCIQQPPPPHFLCPTSLRNKDVFPKLQFGVQSAVDPGPLSHLPILAVAAKETRATESPESCTMPSTAWSCQGLIWFAAVTVLRKESCLPHSGLSADILLCVNRPVSRWSSPAFVLTPAPEYKLQNWPVPALGQHLRQSFRTHQTEELPPGSFVSYSSLYLPFLTLTAVFVTLNLSPSKLPTCDTREVPDGQAYLG